MGIRSRYAASFLIILLVPAIVQGATRTKLKPTAQSIVTESTAGVSYPNGAVAYFGADRVYSLDYSVNARTGDVVAPTVRPVTPSTIGTPYFPDGGRGLNPDISAQKLTVKPKAIVPKPPVFSKFKTLIKANPAGLLFTAGTLAATAAVGWAFDELTGQLTKESTVPASTSSYGWKAGSLSSTSPIYPTPTQSCHAASLSQNYGCQAGACVFEKIQLGSGADSRTCDAYRRVLSTGAVQVYRTDRVWRVGTCTAPQIFNAELGTCSIPNGSVPISSLDVDTADFSAIPQDWFDSMLRDTCLNSPSPNSCFEELRSHSPIEGPSTIQGSTSTKNQIKINPDGSTTSTTTTTSREHPISYGDGFFDVGTRETITVTENGEPVSTTTTEDTSLPNPVDTTTPEAEPQPQEPQFTFDDSDLPEIEPFYEVIYVDGLSGVWTNAHVSTQQTAFVEFMQGFVPSFSGSCPSFGLSFAIASWASFGNIEFSSLCYILDFVKILLLVTAMFTSRAIIFGG